MLIFALNWGLTSKVALSYNSNIYKLGEKESDEFRSGLYPSKYPFKTADDLGLAFNSNLHLSHKLFRWGLTELNLSLRSTQYANNKIKDWMHLSTSLSQEVKNWKLSLGFSYIPNYTIRYYKPVGSSSYLPCNFERKAFSTKISYKIKKSKINTELRIWKDTYDKAFSYYNSDNFYASTTFNTAPFRRWQGEVGFAFTNSRAVGKNPDISYQGYTVFTQIKYMPRLRKLRNLLFTYTLDYREYTTENSPLVDYLHAGRYEYTHRVGIRSEQRITYGVSSEISLEREFRKSFSAIYPEIGGLKNYGCWILGINFVFRI